MMGKAHVIKGVIALFIGCLCIVSEAAGQGEVRLALLGGGEVPFVFNTMKKYKNGITYNNWTLLGITCKDTDLTVGGPTPAYDTPSWTLDFKANAAQFNGDGGGSLPLASLLVTASNAAGPSTGITYNGPLALTTADQQLVVANIPPGAEPNATTNQVYLSYACGTLAGNNLLGQTADYYEVDIVLTLTANFSFP